MNKRHSTTGLLHPLSWYIKEYEIPEQTVVNAYRRKWPLDDPHELLLRFLHAPGPKSSGLQALMNYCNGQSGPSAVSRGSSKNASKPKAESSVRRPAAEQAGDPKKILVELTVGDRIYWQLITPAETDELIRFNDRPWLTKPA
jgi:hypothetical protein